MIKVTRPISAAVGLALLSPGAFAQEPQSASQSVATGVGQHIAEVIVTARKREEKASDIPGTVQVLDQAQLAERGVADMADLQRAIPNFVFSTGRPFESQVKMRGIGTPTLNVPGVGLYIDGAYQVWSVLAGDRVPDDAVGCGPRVGVAEAAAAELRFWDARAASVSPYRQHVRRRPAVGSSRDQGGPRRGDPMAG